MAFTIFIAGFTALARATPPATTQGVYTPPAENQTDQSATTTAQGGTSASMYIQEYRVLGAHQLTGKQVEAAVYPYLGPARTPADVDQARAALEKAYQEAGYQTVSVEIPQQKVKHGIVVLQVVENKVGRLRVRGARYFSPSQIKQQLPSLAEGGVPNFNHVSQEIVALNQLPDRQVTPTLKAGVEPGTVDVDINVKDTLPLHGSLELNNRYSPNTTPLRVNGSVSYTNLWQLGHSIGFSFQIAPQRPSDAEVASAYYLARLPSLPWLSLLLQGTKQNSNVSTLGGGNVVGNGEMAGARLIVSLPPLKEFSHSVALEVDYKHFDQDLFVGGSLTGSPITYYPVSLSYSAAWVTKYSTTEFNGGVTFGLRGTSPSEADFDNSRFDADSGFFYFRGKLDRTQELPLGFQAYAEIQGQAANEPLVASEQFSGGGLDTVRGYLESEVLGDNAIVSTFELRTPSLHGWGLDEMRLYVFSDAGVFTLNNPLPGQQSQFDLASVGVGGRIRTFSHLNGSLDAGVPLITQAPNTTAGSVLVTFRLWGNF
ncbi:MAG: ShlB/FhaC/HecB family hemolysin secretion/activation protein [Chthoniobacterales bacterium]